MMNENFDEYYSSFSAEPFNSVPSINQHDFYSSEQSYTQSSNKKALSCPVQSSDSNQLLIINEQSKKIYKKEKRFINWTDKEDQIAFDKIMIYGFNWQRISTFLHKKSRLDIKNHFHSVLKSALREKQCPLVQLNDHKKPNSKESHLKKLLINAIISQEMFVKIKQRQLENKQGKKFVYSDYGNLQTLKLKDQDIYLCSKIQLTEEIKGNVLSSDTLENQLREIIIIIQQQSDTLRAQLLSTIFQIESYAENNFLGDNQQIFDSCWKIQEIIKKIDFNSSNGINQLNFAIERLQGNNNKSNFTEIQTILSNSMFTLMESKQDLSETRIKMENVCQIGKQLNYFEEN